jgi:hypothetical protein
VARHRWAQVLDYGVAEAWAQDHEHELIDKFALDETMPWIHEVESVREYHNEVAAVRGYCAELAAAREGVSPEQELQWLNRHDTPSKIGMIVAGPFEQHRLRWLVPRHSWHTELLAAEAAMTDVLDQVPEGGGADAVAASGRLGTESVRSMLQHLREIRARYPNPDLLELLETNKHVDAALQFSGADHSSFAGYVGEAPTPSGKFVVFGVSTWTNLIKLSSEHVVQQLREMYATEPGAEVSDEKLKQWRRALSTLLHENGHLFAPNGQLNGDAAEISKQDWAVNAEESFTNAWTERNLNAYIKALGIHERFPRILEVRHEMTYPRLTNAAHAIADGIGSMGGRSGEAARRVSDEVLRRVNNETTVFKLEELAQIMYDEGGLGDVVPAELDLPWHARREIVEVLRSEFVTLDEIPAPNEEPDKLTVEQVRELATRGGERIFQQALAKVEEIRGRYAGPGGQALGQAVHAASSGVAVPGGSSKPTAPAATSAATGHRDRGKGAAAGSSFSVAW